MKMSSSSEHKPRAELNKVVKTMRNVTLSDNFWNELKAEVEITDDLSRNHDLLQKLTQFQHHAEFKRTSKLVQSYDFENSLISLNAHDQGANSFTCWAYSSATMIGNSCRVMISDLRKRDLICEETYNECMSQINDSSFHTRTRNAILMILMPRQLHVDDETQAAFLQAAVSRLANETIIDREGVFYLETVTNIVGDWGLDLKDFPVHVTYRTYYNKHHREYQTNAEPLIDEAVQNKLCPVAAVDVSSIPDGPTGHEVHAMVLDTIREGNFIFKNTYVANKQVVIPMEKGPLKFFYVHLELNENGLNQL